MSSVLGVSVGAGAIRLARPPAGAAPGTGPDLGVPESFELRTFVVPPETASAERAALSVAAALNSNPAIATTVLACRDEQQARALHTAMNDHALTDYDIVPDIEAVVEFAAASGALTDLSSLAVFDLGASGLSVTVVDVSTRKVRHTERTSDISGEYFDSLIREQQINSGRIAHPPDPAGLAELDALCRSAKERLSAGNAVALPSSYGPVLLTQENFTALIARAVETAARATREVIERSGRPVQAVLAVGGGMRIPLVSQALRDTVEMPVLVPPEPETATARGAALLASRTPAPRSAEPTAASETGPVPHPSSAEGTASGPPEGNGAFPWQVDAGHALHSAAPTSGVGAEQPGSTVDTGTAVLHNADTISAFATHTDFPGSSPAPPDPTTALPGSPAVPGTATAPPSSGSVTPGFAPAPPGSGTAAAQFGPTDSPTGPAITATNHSGSYPAPADPRTTSGSQRSRPDLPIPHEGIFGPPTEAPSTLISVGSTMSAASTNLRSSGEPNDPPAPASALPHPSPAPQLSPDEDPPTVALRLPAKLLPRRSFDEPPQRPRREINAAMVAVSALVVVASIGIGLGYGRHMFSQDSASVQDTSQPQAPSATTASPPTAPPSATATPSEHAPLAEPPPVYQPEPAAPTTTTPGPNTFQVPGLPPIVVPTIPPEALPFQRPAPTER